MSRKSKSEYIGEKRRSYEKAGKAKRSRMRVFPYLINNGRHDLSNPLFADSVVLGKPAMAPCRPVLKTVMPREYQPVPPPHSNLGQKSRLGTGTVQCRQKSFA